MAPSRRGRWKNRNSAQTYRQRPISMAPTSTSGTITRFPKVVHIWWGANHLSEVFQPSSCCIVWDKDNGESFFADAELASCSATTAVRIFKHTWTGLIKESERGQKRVHPRKSPSPSPPGAWKI